MSDKKEDWEKAYDKAVCNIKLSEYNLDASDLVKVWLAACEYQQKKLDIAVETLKYVKSGISHIESKTECRHCAIDQALEKIEGEK